MTSLTSTQQTKRTNHTMTLNKLAFSLVGSLALATAGFAGTAPAKSGKACTSCTPPAAEESLGLSVGVGYDSNFVFRGANLADNWISADIGYSIPLTDKVKFNLGAVYGSSPDDGFLDNSVAAALGVNSYQRLELAAGFAVDLGGAELGLGYRWYHHMGDASAIMDDGNEVGLTLATKAGPINIGIGANYDFDIDGFYFEAGLNTEIKLTESISLVPGASIGYAVDYSYHIQGLNVDGFTAVNLSLGLPIKLSKHATLTPFVAWNLPIDGLDEEGSVLADDQLHGGVRLSLSF